jgi:uncharacterized protein (TIGR02145 family)
VATTQNKMKIPSIILGITIFSFSELTSCEEGSNQKAAESNLKEISSIEQNDSKIIQNEKVTFPTINIDHEEWMTEDINVTTYNNGDPIYEASSESEWKQCGNKKQGCYRKLNNGTFVYNGFAVFDSRGILPIGYALPTYNQYSKLFTFLGGGDSPSGAATKSLATYPIYLEEWIGDEETGGLEEIEIKTNGLSGFNARKGGFVYDHGAIGSEGNCSYWWTSTSQGQEKIVVDIGYCSQDLGGGKGNYPPTYGFAVRAIKK